MSIDTSTYEMDAGRHVVERHTDHLGQQYMQSWYAPADWTTQQIQAWVADHAAQIDVSLAEGEADEVLQ